jgi:diguanylate cyclase (GGDEF)-like protein/PAS domain S-box-containing protein
MDAVKPAASAWRLGAGARPARQTRPVHWFAAVGRWCRSRWRGPRGGAQAAVIERRAPTEAVFEGLWDGAVIVDAAHRMLRANAAYCRLVGMPRERLLGSVPAVIEAVLRSPGLEPQRRALQAALDAGSAWRGEVVERRRNGDPRALQVTVSPLAGTEAAPRRAVVVADITHAWLQREQLERQVELDPLTQLPNRLRLGRLLQQAMQASDAGGHLLLVCHLDLDHFKRLNDEVGHAAGDRVLVEIAGRLRNTLRTGPDGADVVARLGGDEFVLLIQAVSPEEGRLAVERLLGVIGAPLASLPRAEPVQITASAGATLYPLDRADADTVLRHADHAMYGAKQAGRSGYMFFDAEHSRQTEARYEALGRVQEALERHEFVLHYQPKVDLRSGAVLGLEALLRWRHPREGLVVPGRFLPLIEHTSLSARLGDWVFEQAIGQLAAWRRLGLELSVSVNVSARHLQSPRFAERLQELLAAHAQALAPHLELEVLETAALADVAYTCALMERCRAFGVRFALDDFGTGYSTLTYLRRLPLDVLKIDRSFVHQMLDDHEDEAIIEGVVGLARTFGCIAVAEGVESAAQASRLLALGCAIGQGNGIAEPMAAEAVPAWVRGYRGLGGDAMA